MRLASLLTTRNLATGGFLLAGVASLVPSFGPVPLGAMAISAMLLAFDAWLARGAALSATVDASFERERVARGELEAKVDALRRDVTHVASAVGVRAKAPSKL